MQTLAQVLILVGVAIIIVFVRAIPRYFDEKAKNLAQKEDLKDLTEAVERVRDQFDKSKLVHRVQFEAEFRCYENVWRAAGQVHSRLIRVYPTTQFHEVTDEFVRDFGKEQEKFSHTLEGARPFIFEEVFQKFDAFELIVIQGKMAVLMKEPIADVRGYREEVRAAIEQCGEAIRRRLAGLLVV